MEFNVNIKQEHFLEDEESYYKNVEIKQEDNESASICTNSDIDKVDLQIKIETNTNGHDLSEDNFIITEIKRETEDETLLDIDMGATTNPETPLMMNPKGKYVSSSQRKAIVYMYQMKMSQQPSLKVKELVKLLSKEMGIGQRTIQSTIFEYKRHKTITLPCKKKNRPTYKDKMDDNERNAIRKKIHSFWFQQQIPTINKILVAINNDTSINNVKRSTLHKIIRDLNFEYVKRGRNSALLEKDDIVLWRSKFIQQIRKYRAESKTIYYVDEMFINIEANTKNKSKRFIVVHIGSHEGFVNGALLCTESNDVNSDMFIDWLKGVMPLLKDNSVLVMDDAPYHSVKQVQSPTLCWKKKDIEKWLFDNCISVKEQLNKTCLIDIVKSTEQQFNKYIVDEYVKSKNIVVLRIPPYHNELNAIDLAWTFIKDYIKAHNYVNVNKLISDGVEKCTPDMWKSFVQHTINEEDKFWNLDFIIDDLLEVENENNHIVTTSDDSDDDFASAVLN